MIVARRVFAAPKDCDSALKHPFEVTDLTMPKPNHSAEALTGPALAWSGDDPVELSAALAALEEAGIPVHEMTELDPLPPISGPQYRIFVPSEQASRAQKAIREALNARAEGNKKE